MPRHPESLPSDRADPSGRPDIYFVPEPGDELSFAVSRSVLSWPTPFDDYIMVRTPDYSTLPLRLIMGTSSAHCISLR
jgi:hypothetical protein